MVIYSKGNDICIPKLKQLKLLYLHSFVHKYLDNGSSFRIKVVC